MVFKILKMKGSFIMVVIRNSQASSYSSANATVAPVECALEGLGVHRLEERHLTYLPL